MKELIPKIIRTCWFSGEKYPVEIRRCMDTWRRIRANDSEQHVSGYLSVYPTERLLPCRSYDGRHDLAFDVHTIYGSWRKRKLGRKIELKIKH